MAAVLEGAPPGLPRGLCGSLSARPSRCPFSRVCPGMQRVLSRSAGLCGGVVRLAHGAADALHREALPCRHPGARCTRGVRSIPPGRFPLGRAALPLRAGACASPHVSGPRGRGPTGPGCARRIARVCWGAAPVVWRYRVRRYRESRHRECVRSGARAREEASRPSRLSRYGNRVSRALSRAAERQVVGLVQVRSVLGGGLTLDGTRRARQAAGLRRRAATFLSGARPLTGSRLERVLGLTG
jgi:hypothetical protein